MADVFKLDNSSRENLKNFINSIDDNEIRDLLQNQLDHIIAVGRLDDKNPKREDHKEAFFRAVEQLIKEEVENYED
jgi:hypothetical protein